MAIAVYKITMPCSFWLSRTGAHFPYIVALQELIAEPYRYWMNVTNENLINSVVLSTLSISAEGIQL